MNKTERNSVFELFRLIAMFIIVFYHFLMNILYSLPDTGSHSRVLLESFMPTIHIGVILFVLISGYFGIKPSVKGILWLLALTAVYYLSPYFVTDIMHHRISWYRFLFVSHTPYWFIRTYVYLYLAAPLVNAGWKALNRNHRICVLIALGLISMWFGWQGDYSLSDGKNLTHFVFLYLLGNSLRLTEAKWKRIKPIYLALCWVIINVSLIVILNLFSTETTFGSTIFSISFPYNSPLLIVNSCLVFCLFARLQFHSRLINTIAQSTFPIYLIHGHPSFIKLLMLPACEYVVSAPMGGVFAGLLFAATIIVMVLCIAIDKALTPLWKLIKNFCAAIDLKVAGFYKQNNNKS